MPLDVSVATTKYSFAELEKLWIDAGGPATAAATAAAVAIAESSGYGNNFNPTDPAGGSRGLWQINGVHVAAGDDPTKLYDARANAAQAVAIYKDAGGTFGRDWSTFKSGAYLRFLTLGIAPAPVVAGTPIAFKGQTDGKAEVASGLGTTTPARNPLDVGGKISDALTAFSANAITAVDGWVFNATLAAIALALMAGGIAIAAADSSGSDDGGEKTKIVPVPV